MKMEFLVNQTINDGNQIFITESEFKKAKDDDDEYDHFAFATNCLFAFYGSDDFISRDEYDIILSKLDKGGAVIITVIAERYYGGRIKNVYPEVFVSNNNRLKKVILH